LACDAENVGGKIFNIACGESFNLNELVGKLNVILGKNIYPVYADPRQGDVKHSLANTGRAKLWLDYSSTVSFDEGLEKTVEWYENLR